MVGVVVLLQIDLGVRPEVFRKPPVSVEDWSRHQDSEGRMRDVPHLKQAIFKGVGSFISLGSHPPFTAGSV